jgi:hypothetical protein
MFRSSAHHFLGELRRVFRLIEAACEATSELANLPSADAPFERRRGSTTCMGASAGANGNR